MLQAAAVEKAETWRFGAAKGKSSVFIITYEFRIEGQEVETPVGCSKVKLDLPTTVEVSSPPDSSTNERHSLVQPVQGIIGWC